MRAAFVGALFFASSSLSAGGADGATRLVLGSTTVPPPVGVDLASPSESRARVLRREQRWHGLPVLGRGVVDVPWSSTRVLDVETDLPRSARPVYAREDAARRAQAFTRRPLSTTDARLVVHAGPRGARLAWLVTPPVGPLPTAPLVVIDAVDGRVLEARERVRRASALTYRENPVREAAPELLPILGPPPGSTLTSPALVARSCVDRGGTNTVDVGGMARAVRVCGLEQVAAANTAADFVFPPRPRPEPARNQADPFAETSLFWHAARLRAFVEALAGSGAPTFQDPPLDLVAGLKVAAGIDEGDFERASRTDVDLEPFAGGFFLPGVGEGEVFRALYGATRSAVWLGQGANVDFAYDGDVVTHEVTHALVHATLAVGGYRWTDAGVSAEPEAIDEALADYVAAALANDPTIGEYAATESAQSAAALRSLENTASCSTSMVGEPHDDSLVISGALWTTRASLPQGRRAAFDGAVLQALTTSPGRRDLGFEDFAALVRMRLAVDVVDAIGAFDAALAARGVLAGCDTTRTLEPERPVRARLSPFVAPGTDDVGEEALAPGVVQFRLEIPPGTVAVRFSFRPMSPVPSALFGRQGTPFQPVVLAAWGRPVTWRRDVDGASRAGVDARAIPEGGARVFTELAIPEGTKVVHFQIANQGQMTGLYDDVSVSIVPVPEERGDAGVTAEAGAEPDQVLVSPSGSGCSCRSASPSSSGTSSLAVSMSCALGLALLRRSRRWQKRREPASL